VRKTDEVIRDHTELCHFHGQLFARQMMDKPICRHPQQCAALATRCSSVLIARRGVHWQFRTNSAGPSEKRVYRDVSMELYRAHAVSPPSMIMDWPVT
jgi:hypothetical protein